MQARTPEQERFERRAQIAAQHRAEHGTPPALTRAAIIFTTSLALDGRARFLSATSRPDPDDLQDDDGDDETVPTTRLSVRRPATRRMSPAGEVFRRNLARRLCEQDVAVGKFLRSLGAV
jgi:hypothetical protein